MACIDTIQQFSADDYDGLVIGFSAEFTNHDSGFHVHKRDQLIFSHRGCIVISLDGFRCVLAPMRAAWIPAGVAHRTQTTNLAHYCSINFSPSLKSRLPRDVKIFDINSLMAVLFERMASWPVDKADDEQINSVNLLIEELNLVSDSYLNLPIPKDPRLQSWIKNIDDKHFTAPMLGELSQQVGASTKTITRIFNKEVGMSYQSWRQQWRLLSAIELLSNNWRVADVAHQLAFSSDSAFISFFRDKSGYTPSMFIQGKLLK